MLTYRVADGRMHLIASIHQLPHDYQLPGTVNALHRAVKHVIFETDLAAAQDVDWDRVSSLDARTSLDQMLPPTLFAAAKAAWRSAGLQGKLARTKPWFASLQLTAALIEDLGLDAARGFDHLLWDASSSTSRIGLEDVLAPFACFDAAPRREQNRMVALPAQNPDLAKRRLVDVYEAWTKADVNALEAVSSLMAEETPELQKLLIDGRNCAWMPRLVDQIHSADSSLVVVGALHLVGASSLPVLLSKAGFVVERVSL